MQNMKISKIEPQSSVDKIDGSSNVKTINAISILRIIATFMVVMVHFGQSLPLPSVFHRFVRYGAEGVTFFFIISGYVIAASLDRNSSVLIFYKKRLIRIVPMYYAVVIVNIILSTILRTYPADITHLSWLRYFLFIQAIIPTDYYFYWNNAAALWTMSAFMFFYLIAPGIHAIVNRGNHNSLKIVMGGVLLRLISAAIYDQFSGVFEASGDYLATHSPFAVFFEFFVGMYIYYSCHESSKTIWIVLIGILGSIFKIERFVVTGLFGMLLYCIKDKKVRSNRIVNSILDKMDEYSFSIYLGHTTVMFIFSRIQEVMGFNNIKLSIYDIFGCVIFIPILHELIEKPGATIAKRIFNCELC